MKYIETQREVDHHLVPLAPAIAVMNQNEGSCWKLVKDNQGRLLLYYNNALLINPLLLLLLLKKTADCWRTLESADFLYWQDEAPIMISGDTCLVNCRV